MMLSGVKRAPATLLGAARRRCTALARSGARRPLDHRRLLGCIRARRGRRARVRPLAAPRSRRPSARDAPGRLPAGAGRGRLGDRSACSRAALVRPPRAGVVGRHRRRRRGWRRSARGSACSHSASARRSRAAAEPFGRRRRDHRADHGRTGARARAAAGAGAPARPQAGARACRRDDRRQVSGSEHANRSHT